MKCTTVIDKSRDEEVIIYAHENSELVLRIEELVNGDKSALIGYTDREIVQLSPSEVFCFISENGKSFALTEKGRMRIKLRLYEIEELMTDGFVKINQSCIANVSRIAKFDTSIAGALTVLFKNGYKDYVSRRQLKMVKERIGFKR